MTPLDLAVAWVHAGGGQGKEREALVKAREADAVAAFAAAGWSK